MSKYVLALIASIGLIVGCSIFKPPAVPDGPLQFRTVVGSIHSLADTAAIYQVDNNRQWQDVWKLAMGRIDPLPETPNIDFSGESVLAVFMGRHNSSGYRNEIGGMKKSGRKLTVLVRNYRSKGGMILPVVTSPFQIVAMPKGKYQLDLRYEQIDE